MKPFIRLPPPHTHVAVAKLAAWQHEALVVAVRTLEDSGRRAVADFMGVFLRKTNQCTGMPDAGELHPEKRGESLGSRLRR